MTDDKELKQKPAPGVAGSAANSQTGNVQNKSKEPPLLNNPAGREAAPNKPSRALIWFAILIGLLAIAATGYTYWQLERYRLASQEGAKENEQRQVSELESKVENQVRSQTATFAASLADYRNQLKDQQSAIAELRAGVSDTRRQVGEITHVSRKSWMLAEAEYLLRLANQRLIMEQEISSALALLQSADQILQDVEDVNLYPVRAEIAKEIAALRAVGGFDLEGAFLALAALSEQLVDLPLISPRTPPASRDEKAPALTSFQAALARFEKLVTVRRREQPVAPLLPPDQHYYVQQNLRLMLEQAQLALLQRKPLLYSQSLNKAEQWVLDYFELNVSSGALRESLADLKQLQIAPPLPNISRSLVLLKDYLSNPELELEADPSSGGAAP